MQVIKEINALRNTLNSLRSDPPVPNNVGFVATKGSIHAGHEALIATSLEEAHVTAVSIFSHPAQFQDVEHYTNYPTNLEQDIARLDAMGVHVLYLPNEAELLPNGIDGQARVDLPIPNYLHDRLIIDVDQGSINNQATLTLKLINLVQPDLYYTSEKDIQQATMAGQMLQDFNLPIKFRLLPTARDNDGTVISTKTQFLSDEQKMILPILHQTLNDLGHALRAGASHYDKLEQTAKVALRGAGFNTEYVAICDADTLDRVHADTQRFRVLAAAKLGKINLTDNIYVAL